MEVLPEDERVNRAALCWKFLAKFPLCWTIPDSAEVSSTRIELPESAQLANRLNYIEDFGYLFECLCCKTEV